MAVFKSNIDWNNYEPEGSCNPSGTEEIDPEIAELISLMNQTGWIETSFSCQGGLGHNDQEPYIVFSCKSEKVPTLLNILENAVPVVKLEMTEELPDGSVEINIRLSDTDPQAISSLEASFKKFFDTIR